MRRFFYFFLIAIILASQMPASVSAKSNNYVDRIQSVAEDYIFTLNDAPYLVIELSSATPLTHKDTFRLTLTGALWNEGETGKSGIAITEKNIISMSPQAQGYNFSVIRLSDTTIEIQANREDETAAGFSGAIIIPILATVEKEETAYVTIEEGSVISADRYAFATITTLGTYIQINAVNNISETGTTLGDFIINENYIGALNGEKEIVLKAPPHYVWQAYDWETPSNTVTFAGGRSQSPPPAKIESHENMLTIRWDSGLPNASQIGSIIIKGLKIKPDAEASLGEVYVAVNGLKVTSQRILAGYYTDHDLIFYTNGDTLPQILAGRYEGRKDNKDTLAYDAIKTLEMVIEEKIPASWWGSRLTHITVPEGIKIRAATFRFGRTDEDFVLDQMEKSKDVGISGNVSSATVTLRERSIEIKNLTTFYNQTASMYLTLYISADASYRGEVPATLSGGGLEQSYTVPVAEVIAPVTISSKSSDIRIGYKDVEVNDILIRENAPGAIRKEIYSPQNYDNKVLAYTKLQIEKADLLKFGEISEVQIVEGDILLDDVTIEDGVIQFAVKSESELASTIALRGITMNIDRIPPEGFYTLSIGGDAIIDNYNPDTNYLGYFDNGFIELEKAYDVVTSAPGAASDYNQYIRLAIGEDTMTVGSSIWRLDVAPYISNDRTMLPVLSVANAFGISDSQVLWDAESQVVTLVTSSKTVQLTAGSTTLLSNGVPIQMDAVMEVKNGVPCLPISWLAISLGVEFPLWDPVERTVTFNRDNDPLH